MKFPFVTRKKYEFLKHNYKILNEYRFKLTEKNIELQKEILELKNKLKGE